MADQNSIEDASTTAGSNDNIGGVNIAEGSTIISDFNNALRESRAQQKQMLATQAGDVASATTLDLSSAIGTIFDITGTTTVTAVTLADGLIRRARATGAFQITAGASLVVNGSTSVNYTTTAGDLLFFMGDASSVVRVWTVPHLAAVSVDILPDADSTRDLGATSNAFAEAHVDKLLAATLSDQAASEDIAITYVINGSAKSWLNMDGTGTAAINDSFNVSSITDITTGRYDVNLTNAMDSTNYSAVGSAQTTGSTGSNRATGATASTSSKAYINVMVTSTGANNDQDSVSLTIQGNLA